MNFNTKVTIILGGITTALFGAVYFFFPGQMIWTGFVAAGFGTTAGVVVSMMK